MNKGLRTGIIAGVLAFIIGIAVTLFTVYQVAPSVMMLEDESPYGFEETVERFETEVDAAGWSILNVHDMAAIMDNHGHDVESIKIFDLCSSEYSAEILELDEERIVSPMMPCRISIYEHSDGMTYISRMNASMMAGMFGGQIERTMDVATEESEAIIDAVLAE